MKRLLYIFLLWSTVTSAEDSMKRLIPILEKINNQEHLVVVCENKYEDDKTKFCLSPYEYICSDSTSSRPEQDKRIKVFKDQLKDIKRWDKQLELVNLLVKNKKLELNQEDLYDYKNAVLKAIEQSHFSSNDKKRFKANFKNMEIIQASDFKLKLIKDLDAGLDISKQNRELDIYISQVCDNGLLPMAFAEDTIDGKKNKGKKRIVICDGSLLMAEGARDRNVAIIMHEISHFFNSTYDEETYANSFSCFLKNMGERVLKEYEISMRESGYDLGINKENREERMISIARAQMDEFSCDAWAVDAYAIYHANKKSRPEEILKSMKEAYGFFCGRPSGGTHPSGRMRIEMMGNHPDIRRQVGCLGEVEKDSQLKLCTY